MNPEELQQEIEDLKASVESLLSDNESHTSEIEGLSDELIRLDDKMGRHQHAGRDETTPIVYILQGGKKIRFEGLNTQYEIYREAGDSGELRIDSTTDTRGTIQIGGLKKPLNAYITGTDEALLRADNNITNTGLLVEPTKIGIFTTGSNEFRFGFPNLSGEPSTCSVGDLTVVNAVLKVCTSSNTWTVVGTQT